MFRVTQSSACILCSINCGLELEVDEQHILAVRGDRDHPASRGYLCEKPRRLDLYQNSEARLTAPLRRRPDGSFEELTWEQAIEEVAARLGAVRDAHGGRSIFYYGGGAQGNHLGGVYSHATRAAFGAVFSSNALAQEKTGEFWVDGQLFGAERCHTCPDFERAEVALFVGKNPWQSHGFARARVVLRDIARDPNRALIVIDPRRSETAALADIHLQVRPGMDAWLLLGLLGSLLAEGGVDLGFVAERCHGFEAVSEALGAFPFADCCERAGVAPELVRKAAARIAAAASVSVLEDLGVQQGPESTLCSYLEKLIYLLTGNFGKAGAMNIHSRFAGLGGGPAVRRERAAPVTGARLLAGLVPCNHIPESILTDHPERFRAMIIESANPVHSLAGSASMRAALQALDFVVCIDVAMTETARCADIVLPACSQLEKWECTFFNLEFPDNVFHLRTPLFPPRPGTLPECEIHARLTRASGALEGLDLEPLITAAAEGLDAYAQAFAEASMRDRRVTKLAPVVLYLTLGPALPAGAEETAALWALAQRCAVNEGDSVRRAGFSGEPPELGNALFEAILGAASGLVFSRDEAGATWRRIAHADRRVQLALPELLEELAGLEERTDARAQAAADWPFVLAAGERRSSTANTLYRDPSWRDSDREGCLRIAPVDAARLGLADGDAARLVTPGGEARVLIEVYEGMARGQLSLPNGQGLDVSVEGASPERVGVAPNELTSCADRDRIAGTPWHKYVRARLEALS